MPAHSSAAATPLPYTAVLTYRVLQDDLCCVEPDFDQVYRVVVTGVLHDTRPAGIAAPDSQLVLSLNLEMYQRGTALILPDLLNPRVIPPDIEGFLTGKAALVSAAGHIAYKGNALAELFHKGAVHIVLQLYAVVAGAKATPIVLQGTFVLMVGGTRRGTLHSPDQSDFEALRVPQVHPLPWQTVLAALAVPPPPYALPVTHGCGIGTVQCAATPSPHAGPRLGTVPRPVPPVPASSAAIHDAKALALRPRQGSRPVNALGWSAHDGVTFVWWLSGALGLELFGVTLYTVGRQRLRA